MARFASRRKSFRSRKPLARKKLGWVNTTIDSSIPLLEDGLYANAADGWQRIPVLTRADWESNEFMSSRATLIRVVTQLQVVLVKNYIGESITIGNATWRVIQPLGLTLVAGDLADLENYTGPPTDDPTTPDYFLNNDVVKHTSITLWSSGSWSVDATNTITSDQETAAHLSSGISVSSKTRRSLKNDSAIFLDFAPEYLPGAEPEFWQFTNGSLPSDYNWTAKLIGTVRCLVQYT